MKKAASNAAFLLGYPDSNQKKQDQNLLCCQLHHTPISYATRFIPELQCKSTALF